MNVCGGSLLSLIAVFQMTYFLFMPFPASVFRQGGVLGSDCGSGQTEKLTVQYGNLRNVPNFSFCFDWSWFLVKSTTFMLKPVFWVNTCSSTSHQEKEHFTRRRCVCWCGEEWGAVCCMYNRMWGCVCALWGESRGHVQGRTGNIKGPKEQKKEWTESVFLLVTGSLCAYTCTYISVLYFELLCSCQEGEWWCKEETTWLTDCTLICLLSHRWKMTRKHRELQRMSTHK